MAFRQGDPVIINIGKTAIRFNLEAQIYLFAVVQEGDKEGALDFLSENVLPHLKDDINPDITVVKGIIEQKESDSALDYVTNVINRKVHDYINTPACKSAFELSLRGY